MQLAGNKISFYCSLAIPSSLRSSLRIASPLPKAKKAQFFCAFCFTREPRLHPQVFANAKVACDARRYFNVQLSKRKISYYCSLAIPSSLRSSLRIASPLPKPKKRSSSALFALQESRDCIRKFLRMQKLRVTLAVVLMCNFLKGKSLITARSLFRPHFVRPYESRLPCQKPKKRSSSALFALQESRDCIRKFLRMQKLRVTHLFEFIAYCDKSLKLVCQNILVKTSLILWHFA